MLPGMAPMAALAQAPQGCCSAEGSAAVSVLLQALGDAGVFSVSCNDLPLSVLLACASITSVRWYIYQTFLIHQTFAF